MQLRTERAEQFIYLTPTHGFVCTFNGVAQNRLNISISWSCGYDLVFEGGKIT